MKIIVLSLCLFFFIFHAEVSAIEKSHKAANSPAYLSKTNQKTVRLTVTSSRQAAQMVTARFGGKVLKVQNQSSNGQQGYRVKLIKTNGNIISVWVNAKSGRLSKH